MTFVMMDGARSGARPRPRAARPGQSWTLSARRLRRLHTGDGAGLLQRRAVAVALGGELEQALVVLLRRGFVARLLGGARGAGDPAEAVGLELHRVLIGRERLFRLAGSEQHVAQKLARGDDRPRRHGMLLGLVLE